MLPVYDLDKIKFATDASTFKRAVGLYESGKIKRFNAEEVGFAAIVQGGNLYSVFVSVQHYDRGTCTCYLGQEGILCKHMVAVAIHAAMEGGPLSKNDKKLVSIPISNGKIGTLSKAELADVKKTVTGALKCIKAYDGPSKIWFTYQRSLEEGCNRLSTIVSELPISEQTAKLLVELLLRLDKKLSYGGIDDSNGTVGGFMEEVVRVLTEYAKIDPGCLSTFGVLEGKETCFGWEEPLLKFLNR